MVLLKLPEKALLQVKVAGYGAAVAAKKGVPPAKDGAVAAAAAKDGCQWH
jgi:hypothetical protein